MFVVFFPSGNLHVAPQTHWYSRQLATLILSAGYKEVSPTSSHKENSSSLLNQLANLPGFNPLKARIVKQYAKTPEEILPTAVEKSLPWRRDRSTYNFGMCLLKKTVSFACFFNKSLASDDQSAFYDHSINFFFSRNNIVCVIIICDYIP